MATDGIAQARRDIKYIASLAKGLIALDDAIEEAGTFEKLIKQTKSRLDALKAEEAASEGRLAKAKDERDKIVAKAKGEADIIATAAAQRRADAEATLQGAKTESANIVAAACNRAAVIERDVVAETAKHNAALAKVKAELQEAQGALDATRRQNEAEQHRLDGINAEIRRLRGMF